MFIQFLLVFGELLPIADLVGDLDEFLALFSRHASSGEIRYDVIVDELFVDVVVAVSVIVGLADGGQLYVFLHFACILP